ncbi:unnamed protein product [Adineta ricciae]|uniref:Apple domain-containing protein n=1 Tax=Adineta ricciae TaxID=249248 RepID=A0A815H649_ADIRI|nr:unnamed protein product [Adineta ricciae]
MTIVTQRSLFYFIHLFNYIQFTKEDQSLSQITQSGWEFLPFDNSIPPLLTTTITTKLIYCSSLCNQRSDCRTYDFDYNTTQCRLWDADITTGSILISSKSQSVVGSIRFSSNIYRNIYNQSCDKCIQSRYSICDQTTNTCQCPLKTYWNGSICTAQLFQNQICSTVKACRTDLNLTCEPQCDRTFRCSSISSIGVGQTIVGSCNGTIGIGSTDLQGPWGIHISPIDGILYVADCDGQTFNSYSPFSRTGRIVLSNGLIQPLDIFVDKTNTLYMVDGSVNEGTVFIQRSGKINSSIPAIGLSTSSCLANELYTAYGVAVDQYGNIYVSLFLCYTVVKWTPGAQNGTVVAGQRLSSGSTSTKLKYVKFIHVNDDQNALYVSDYQNNRIQKFIIGGNGTGITVAGGTGSGTGFNQLNSPAGICVTRDGQTLYVADYNNNRIMKWNIGDTQGSLVAGSATGIPGKTAQLLNGPADLAFDPTETYLYVSDYNNRRIQRFRLR